MLPLNVLIAFLAAHVDDVRRNIREDGDRGEIVTTVIIIAAFAAAAIIIVGILVTKATTAANNVQTQ